MAHHGETPLPCQLRRQLGHAARLAQQVVYGTPAAKLCAADSQPATNKQAASVRTGLDTRSGNETTRPTPGEKHWRRAPPVRMQGGREQMPRKFTTLGCRMEAIRLASCGRGNRQRMAAQFSLGLPGFHRSGPSAKQEQQHHCFWQHAAPRTAASWWVEEAPGIRFQSRLQMNSQCKAGQ